MTEAQFKGSGLQREFMGLLGIHRILKEGGYEPTGEESLHMCE